MSGPRSTTSSRVVRRPPAPRGMRERRGGRRRAPRAGRRRVSSAPRAMRRAYDCASMRPGLEGRDLRQVEHVDDVEAVPGDLDAAEAVDREVAERMRGRGDRQATERHERTRRTTSASSSRVPPRDRRPEQREVRVQLQRAARTTSRVAARLPRQRSIIPRWKSLSASCVPRRSARRRVAAAPRRSGRSARAPRRARRRRRSTAARAAPAARARAMRASRIPWSTSKSAVSRSVLTPFATSSRSITPISAYCRRACSAGRCTRYRSPSIATYCGSGIRLTAALLERDRRADASAARPEPSASASSA